MNWNVGINPVLPWELWVALAAVLVVALALAIRFKLRGWLGRGLAGALALVTLLAPSLETENRVNEPNRVLIVTDRSASQTLSKREATTNLVIESLQNELADVDNTDVRLIDVGDNADNAGTLVFEALNLALQTEAKDRLSGVFIVTDGQVNDAGDARALEVPLHVILTGTRNEWDRRLQITEAPSYALIGDKAELTLLIEDQGQGPNAETAFVQLARDGAPPASYKIPVGRPVKVTVDIPHGGANVLHFSTPEQDGELTDRNNGAIVEINGLRERLRVLLVSGEPHPGERTWRNLLKSDPSVDLVHFTILRPPEKFDGVPVTELALIAFPTRELFMEKIDDFDLIIFDRYNRRGILPGVYFDNIARYVEDGGAVLLSAGPGFASADSLAHSPFGRVLPAIPTARVYKKGYVPTITELGQKHPITENLAPQGTETEWGRWFRHVDLEVLGGDVIMAGNEGRPLLVVDRVGEGRIALLASDHAWLWDRGYEGGGPQGELLRRLSHWMMKEPDLEEETLVASAQGGEITVTRRSLSNDPSLDVSVKAPDGSEQIIQLSELAPGRFTYTLPADQMGLYVFESDELRTVSAVGPAAPKEFSKAIATDEVLSPVVDRGLGGLTWHEDGTPALRSVRLGRVAAGRGWLGIVDREAYRTTDVTFRPLLPAWLWMSLIAFVLVAGWIFEGRRNPKKT